MVIISTSAVEASIHAVSPLLILSTAMSTGLSGAGGSRRQPPAFGGLGASAAGAAAAGAGAVVAAAAAF